MYTLDPKKHQFEALPVSTKIFSSMSNNRRPPPIYPHNSLSRTATALAIPKTSSNKERITNTKNITNNNLAKSKFTVPTTRCTKLSKESMSMETKAAQFSIQSKKESRNNIEGHLKRCDLPKKSGSLITSNSKAMPPRRSSLTTTAFINNRLCNRKAQLPQLIQNSNKENLEEATMVRDLIETAVQTNEGEILNHSLIVGDIKIMQASKTVVDEIDKLRRETETKRLLKATRKFEEHSQKDEEHLEDLNEFLEKSYITRKPNKIRLNTPDDDRKIINSMNDLLNRERPKIESISDIRARIQSKEQELLSLFEHLQATTTHLIRNT